MDTSASLLNNWLGIAATTGHLGLLIVVIRRPRETPLRLPLALLCANMTVWSFAAAAYELFRGFGWHWLEVAASPLTVPLGLHIVLTLVGRRKRYAYFLYGTYVYFVLLSVVGAVWLIFNRPESVVESQLWAAAYLAGVTPPLLYTIYSLRKYARKMPTSDERIQAHLILGGLVLGLALGSTELFNNFLPSINGLAHGGALATTAALTIGALRFRLFDYEVATGSWLVGTTIALFCVAGYLLFFGTSRTAFLVFIAAALAFVAVVGLRELAMNAARRRDRVEHLVTMGRFSAQMAHDVYNPLAAMKSAVQFLESELGDPESLAQQGDILELMGEQVKKIETIVDRYQRISTITTREAPFDLEALLHSEVRTARVSAPHIDFQTEIATELGDCVGDEELLSLVFENVIRNAIEAMPEGGTLTVAASRDRGYVLVTFRDTGCGMSNYALERAFDDFYTTKASGSGLGLAFARRVMDAHGGLIYLSSTPDEGAEVRIQWGKA